MLYKIALGPALLPIALPLSFIHILVVVFMSLFSSIAPITITCHNRIAPYLAQEVAALGFTVDHEFVTGVQLKGSINDCIRLNLHLRCASQILYSLQAFDAHHPDDVYKHCSQIPWENIIPSDGYFSVTSNVLHDSINNNMFANLRVKDAIVDRLREVTGNRPNSGASLDGVVIHLFWKNEQAEVFIDTTGDSLARHGYRKIPGRAPMLEALATATLMATKWDKVGPVVNPMCGSGTLAIEAALIGTNAKPGLFRLNYAFMHLIGYNDAIYRHEMNLLDEQMIDPPNFQIIASDYSQPAIENARKNAIAAGVAKYIQFVCCDFAETPIPVATNGIVILNPEYGERLGEIDELMATYARIGDFFKQRCGGYHGYVFTGNLELGKRVGLKPKRKIPFFNATIDCRLFEFELYAGSKRAPL